MQRLQYLRPFFVLDCVVLQVVSSMEELYKFMNHSNATLDLKVGNELATETPAEGEAAEVSCYYSSTCCKQAVIMFDQTVTSSMYQRMRQTCFVSGHKFSVLCLPSVTLQVMKLDLQPALLLSTVLYVAQHQAPFFYHTLLSCREQTLRLSRWLKLRKIASLCTPS